MKINHRLSLTFTPIAWTCCLLFIASGCVQKEKETVDLLLTNAHIYTVDSTFSKAEAMAIKDGKILAIGKTKDLQAQYKGEAEINAEEKTIVPGLFDAHAHFYGLGSTMQEADLVGATSFDEVVQRVVDFQKEENLNFIQGHGWDQSLWENKDFPTKEKLDEAFPDIPVVLERVDGHASIVNQKALDLAGITKNSKIEGGSFIKKNGNLTGVLVDNARRPLYKIFPESTQESRIDALLKAQELALSYGLTNIADAGTSHEIIQLMNKLALDKQLKIQINPMLIYSDPHLNDYLHNGLGENEAISSHSVKFLSDGAIGSRGAVLKRPYADDPDDYGKLRENPDFIKNLVEKVLDSDFQLNTHAIGDSANHLVLQLYSKALEGTKDRRWRIEHAQIIDPEDLHFFNKNIIPSVQPTHAITDMRFVKDRLGEERAKYGYRNKDLLEQAGLVALGTDSPVEEIDPYRTFYAAVARKNRKGEPKDGFQTENALSREETLKGMTIWAAYAQFDEKTKGSLEPNKEANFVILDRDIMQVPIDSVLNTKVLATYIKGEEVFSQKSE